MCFLSQLASLYVTDSVGKLCGVRGRVILNDGLDRMWRRNHPDIAYTARCPPILYGSVQRTYQGRASAVLIPTGDAVI
jgi:hypothetical protein